MGLAYREKAFAVTGEVISQGRHRSCLQWFQQVQMSQRNRQQEGRQQFGAMGYRSQQLGSHLLNLNSTELWSSWVTSLTPCPEISIPGRQMWKGVKCPSCHLKRNSLVGKTKRDLKVQTCLNQCFLDFQISGTKINLSMTSGSPFQIWLTTDMKQKYETSF